MRVMILVILLSASSCYAQLPATGPGGQAAKALSQGPSDQTATITIPADTIIPAKLVTQITSKARPGDSVRAVTTFPVTVGAQTVIPVGTYLDGVIEKVNKRAPTVDMRFNKLLFANGYTVPIAGEKSQEKADSSYPATAGPNPIADMPVDPGSGPYVDFAVAQQGPFPPPPSLPQMHSHFGTAIGIAVSIMVASLVAVLLLGHHGANGETVLFDAGWPFEIVLKEPASIDVATVASILAASSSY
ncbi:MAG TPA: hypothetical protein VFW94_00320 [Candidatus Acidoferrales bacterium]|nr:hypothetical protein [Candidatus Acidoferrales bacterium]